MLVVIQITLRKVTVTAVLVEICALSIALVSVRFTVYIQLTHTRFMFFSANIKSLEEHTR